MSIVDTEITRGYLLCLLCLPTNGSALVQTAVSAFPLARAKTKHRLRPHPHVMLFADMGSMGRARRGHSWLTGELSDRWLAQDGWISVPTADGRTFRRLMLTAVDRYGLYDAKGEIETVDISELSVNGKSFHHRRTRQTLINTIARKRTKTTDSV